MFAINQNLIDNFADKINEKEKKNNKVSSWSGTPTDINYPSEKLVKDGLDGKQEKLVNGANLKTLNGVGLLGEGNIAIVVDGGNDSISGVSENIIYLGDDIMTMINAALEHIITNWDDYG